MSKYSSLFSQLLQFFPRHEFEAMVRKHNAEYKSKGFSCWQQFVSMLFCQLGRANSLSEITKGLATCEGKLQHLGISAPGKSTLAYANEHRPWELYQCVFFSLLEKAKGLAATGKRKFRFKAKLYSIDATVIDLCLNMFEWAKFRTRKGAIKLHMRLDHDGYLPDYVFITDGKHHESRMAKHFRYESGSITVFDKGYIDFSLFGELCRTGAYFVTRLKDNAVYRIVEYREVSQRSNVIQDALIELQEFYSAQKCPHRLRIVQYFDEEKNRTFIFLTNNLTLAASTIAAIYKERWNIESFFKAIKQYLKIKTFVGTSPNAVKTQIWTALIAILLLKYLQLKSKIVWALSTLSALLRMNLFTYRDLWSWINDPYNTPPIQIPQAEQMCLALG
jgi:hypothetical protein